MIYYVTGALGAGKSYYAVRKIAKALLEGRAVVGNVELKEDWAERIARRNPYAKFSRSARRAYADELRTRYHYEASLEVLTHVKIHGRGEGRALLVLDEAHNDLNNRDWQRTENREFLRWLTMARKKGYLVYVVSQHAQNTDAGVRRIATAQIQLINWKQFARIPILDVPLFPFPLFLAVARPNAESIPANVLKSGKPLWREFFALGWYRHLYETAQVYGEQDDPNAIWLPSHPDVREARRAALLAELAARKAERDSDRIPAVALAARRVAGGRRQT